MRFLELIGGNEDIGRGPLFWLPFALVVAAFLAAPTWLTEFEAYNISFYLLNIPMALGLCLLWGYCGVLSFGQVAYFGIAGYTYGIVAGNLMGLSWGPLAGSLAGLAAAAVVAAVFGYFVFYAPGPDVDRADPDPGADVAAGDVPRPDGGLSVAGRQRPARRLQRHDRASRPSSSAATSSSASRSSTTCWSWC